MPSSNKTQHLQLNKWLGSDKPKKDDFNSDNQKIDEACRLLAQSIELLESAVESNSKLNKQDIASLSSSLSASISSNTSALSTHTGNLGVHVTSSEKEAWSKSSGAILGSYQGDGTTTRKITLGFSPLFVLVFPAGDGIARVNWSNQVFSLNSGYVTNLGSSYGMLLNSDGFTVEYQTAAGMDGQQIKYNASGIKYIYLAFKA